MIEPAAVATGFEHPRPTQPGQPPPMMRTHGSIQSRAETLIDDSEPRRGSQCLPHARSIAYPARSLHRPCLPAPRPNKRASAESTRLEARERFRMIVFEP